MLMYDNDYSESGSIHDWVGDNVTDIAVTDGWLSADREESFSQSLPPRVGFAWDSALRAGSRAMRDCAGAHLNQPMGACRMLLLDLEYRKRSENNQFRFYQAGKQSCFGTVASPAAEPLGFDRWTLSSECDVSWWYMIENDE